MQREEWFYVWTHEAVLYDIRPLVQQSQYCLFRLAAACLVSQAEVFHITDNLILKWRCWGLKLDLLHALPLSHRPPIIVVHVLHHCKKMGRGCELVVEQQLTCRQSQTPWCMCLCTHLGGMTRGSTQLGSWLVILPGLKWRHWSLGDLC